MDLKIINKKHNALQFQFVNEDEIEEAVLVSIEGLVHFGLGRRESDDLKGEGFGDNCFLVVTKTEGPLKGYKYGMVAGVYLYKGEENRNKNGDLIYKDIVFGDMLDFDDIKIYYTVIDKILQVVIYKSEEMIYSTIE